MYEKNNHKWRDTFEVILDFLENFVLISETLPARLIKSRIWSKPQY